MFKNHKSLKKREEKPFNMNQRWLSVEQNIKFN